MKFDARGNSFVLEHQQVIAKWLRSGSVQAVVMDSIVNAANPTESPIEAVFAMWFTAFNELKRGPSYQLSLKPQHEIALPDRLYRVDFALIPEHPLLVAFAKRANQYPLPIAIELDGHEFHERTKEQVKQRDMRDRELQLHGWRLFHYSGSEFVANTIGVVLDVFETAAPMMDVLLRDATAHLQAN